MISTHVSIAQVPAERKTKLREESLQVKYTVLASFLHITNALAHDKSNNVPASLHDKKATYINETNTDAEYEESFTKSCATTSNSRSTCIASKDEAAELSSSGCLLHAGVLFRRDDVVMGLSESEGIVQDTTRVQISA